MQEIGDDFHVLFDHTSGSERVGTDSNSSGDGSTLVSGNGILVEGDVSEIADLLNLGSGQSERSEIPEDEMVVGSGSLKLVVVREEDLGDSFGVGEDLGGIGSESGSVDLLEGDSNTSDGLS